MPTEANNKKKYTYVWVSLIILIFGIIVIPRIVERLKSGSIVERDRLIGGNTTASLSYIATNGAKRKVPEFSFINQDSILISNEDYLGKVYVVEFFFTTCPTICPIMTKNLVELQDTFKNDDAFGIASFSINPRYDTPAVLKRYATNYGVKDSDWHLMTGEQTEIYDLANKGFYIVTNEEKEAEGGFEHSGAFALVDKNGYIRSRTDKFGNPLIYYRGTITEKQGINKDGEAQQITMLKEDIKKLLAE